jgi:hypothetical protein
VSVVCIGFPALAESELGLAVMSAVAGTTWNVIALEVTDEKLGSDLVLFETAVSV